jgi:hypothetical protein
VVDEGLANLLGREVDVDLGVRRSRRQHPTKASSLESGSV